ncbi:MAG: thiamine diphosphokinase [Pseudomonadota bacterium]
MTACVFATQVPVTLIGGGPVSEGDLQAASAVAPAYVAADGGANFAHARNVPVEAVIGDFDSISDVARQSIPTSRQHPVTEQFSTDFEKALRGIDTPLVIGIGFLGGRVDHQLAALHTLLAFPHQPCVLLGVSEIVFLAPPSIQFDARAGDVVSLFPMGRCAGHSTGIAWPINGLAFQPGTKIGTSNIAQGPVQLQMDRPNMLVILPRRYLARIAAQLLEPGAEKWPAPA